MSNAIEMDELPARKSTSAEIPLEHNTDTDAGTGQRAMFPHGSISVWAWTSAIVSVTIPVYLALFSICLLSFPRLLLFLAEPTGGRGTLTALEKYLALSLGTVLGTLAVTIIAMLPNEWPAGLQQRSNSNWHPLLVPVTAASLVMALFSYNNHAVGSLTTTVCLGSSVVGLFGLWMIVFSGPPAISRTTGADKHTSSFLFGNKSAASVKKRLWRRGQQSK